MHICVHMYRSKSIYVYMYVHVWIIYIPKSLLVTLSAKLQT